MSVPRSQRKDETLDELFDHLEDNISSGDYESAANNAGHIAQVTYDEALEDSSYEEKFDQFVEEVATPLINELHLKSEFVRDGPRLTAEYGGVEFNDYAWRECIEEWRQELEGVSRVNNPNHISSSGRMVNEMRNSIDPESLDPDYVIGVHSGGTMPGYVIGELFPDAETFPVRYSIYDEQDSELVMPEGIEEDVDLEDKSVLFVDDTSETGSTMKDIAEISKESGAEEVYGVVASTPGGGPSWMSESGEITRLDRSEVLD